MPPATESQKPAPARTNGPEPPDAYDDPVGYLRSKGWKPLGLPHHANCQWIDPTKPLVETWKEEPIMAWHPPQRKGGPPVYQQVQCPTGQVGGGKRPGFRQVCTPAGSPISLQQALQTQIERDLREAQKK